MVKLQNNVPLKKKQLKGTTLKSKRPNRNPNKYNKNKQLSKYLKRKDIITNAESNEIQKSDKKGQSSKIGSISDTYHKINYLKQISSINQDAALSGGNQNSNILSNFYNQLLNKYILKNKAAVKVSKAYKQYYCKKCFTNKKHNTHQQLLNVHDLSKATSESNTKSLLLQKTCTICGESQNIYIGLNENYVSFEESHIS